MAFLTSMARTTFSTRQLASMNGRLCDGLMSFHKKIGSVHKTGGMACYPCLGQDLRHDERPTLLSHE